MRPNAAKAETNKTIVNIERISDCTSRLNIAKSAFYNFESGAFNHSATLPHKCSEDSMRCVSDKYIVRVLAWGASSFAPPTGGGACDSLGLDACRIDLPFTLTLPK
jgi:hypothetical protein